VDLDLDKMAFVNCCESCNTSLDGLSISPLTGYIRKVILQPAELWLASTRLDAADNDQFEVVSPEVGEASAVNGFIHYVESVWAEPLEYWLCPSCELEFPHTDEPSFEDMDGQSVDCTCTKSETDVASVTSCLHRILSKPESFWLISHHHNVDKVNDNSMELNSPLCSPLHMPCINAVFGGPQTEQAIVHACDFWLSKSSSEDHLDEARFVINDANDLAVSFEYESAIKCWPLGEVASNFSGDYLALLESKPTNYWLYCGNQQIPE